jgi:hypothetical protein
MPTHRQTRGRMVYVILVIAGLFLVLLYFCAYSMTGLRTTGPTEVRAYQHEWQARLFTPAIKIESIIRQKPITITWRRDSPWP